MCGFTNIFGGKNFGRLKKNLERTRVDPGRYLPLRRGQV